MSYDWNSDEWAPMVYRAWGVVHNREACKRLLDPVPVPRLVALRGRYLLLTDDQFTPHPAAAFDESWASWSRHLRLETEGDEALIANDSSAARVAFERLLTLETQSHHRVVTVNALIGLGDAARQLDEHETAAGHYESAIAIARESAYRFGVLRGLVSLGHLSMTVTSAGAAMTLFEDAEQLARDLDEPVYLVNALTGRGEALSRLRRRDEAIGPLEEALQIAENIRSDMGIGNAAQRLADVYQQLGQLDEAAAVLEKATGAFARTGSPIGAANAADALAGIELARGFPKQAAAHYQTAYRHAVEGDYERGQAHACAGLADCAAAVSQWELAEGLYGAALKEYRALSDLVGEVAALHGLARCADEGADVDRALALRLDAVDVVEAMRASHQRHDSQQEYRKRFAAAYDAALRSAVRTGDLDAFTAVFESLAGRRLVGLLERAATGDQAEFLGQMVARADGSFRRGPGEDESPDERRRRIVRQMSALLIRSQLSGPARDALEDTFAALHHPFDRQESKGWIAGTAPGAHLLLITPVPGDGGETAVLWRRPDGAATCQISRLPDETTRLVGTLPGSLVHLALDDLQPLAALLPEGLGDALTVAPAPVVVVPLGGLWVVPWQALPCGQGRVLGEMAPVTMSPSLDVYRRAADRRARHRVGAPLHVVTWRSPAIKTHPLDVYLDDARCRHDSAADAGHVLNALTRAGADLVVIAGHGRPVEGAGHYLELAPDTPLAPADLLRADTPDRLVLVACWEPRRVRRRTATRSPSPRSRLRARPRRSPRRSESWPTRGKPPDSCRPSCTGSRSRPCPWLSTRPSSGY